MLLSGNDLAFRETLHRMFMAFGRLQSFREGFGKVLSLTASQFIVLIGTAYRQGSEGVSIRTLSDHTQLAATHVTTEVGRLIEKGTAGAKSANERDRRGAGAADAKGRSRGRCHQSPAAPRQRPAVSKRVARGLRNRIALPHNLCAQQRIRTRGAAPFRTLSARRAIAGRTMQANQFNTCLLAPRGPRFRARFSCRGAL